MPICDAPFTHNEEPIEEQNIPNMRESACPPKSFVEMILPLMVSATSDPK
eukprot:CAMPEP_0114264128 /NCGR_PEP_ID=MMETSP0058-20121206/22989_1 /TAXON_ID=36894 /ORGANISM="Pyramimonas parkeae, CCMP726" /LENGTH=49 /DNA_ID= /DNA_START= /DNA_END= /DNA_ORIENTATION=